ncbi:HAD-like protein [Basidiobolus meristosporus CBS 931.73]|uniref:Mitochondrial import inner membrane translocase subunit TIM50 n=1 Tax=Basidiobolus meristosporus CBS 931.73 TaxID=1314790 RepID=A0A1Y1YRF5_9FUNG|nr:HAD-like protein [Basidiobolus meristosporus CBS 931.73]|eukprot:ORY00618.1 HAD-like protein [Basidiobolus meristosporus CBS 931.73]
MFAQDTRFTAEGNATGVSTTADRKRSVEEEAADTREKASVKKPRKRAKRKHKKKKAEQGQTEEQASPREHLIEEQGPSVSAKNLLILDLNGTLLVRSKKSKAIYMRPHVPEFVEFILKNFAVIVWSSARPENVNRMILKVFKHRRSLLLDVWDRSHLHLDEKDYYRKVDVVKDLTWVWEKHTQWNKTNTVLIDDTEHKGQLQPDNHICLTEFIKGDTGDNELLNVRAYLEVFLQGSMDDIQSYIRDNAYVPSKTDDLSADEIEHSEE